MTEAYVEKPESRKWKPGVEGRKTRIEKLKCGNAEKLKAEMNFRISTLQNFSVSALS